MKEYEIDEYQNRVGIIFNSDQRELIMNLFKTDIMSNSAPGTGKSTTMAHGLVCHAFMKNVDLSRVICTSYNVASKNELENKFDKILSKFYIRLSKPKFATIDSLCRSILNDNYKRMGTSIDFKYNEPTRTPRIVRSNIEYIESVLSEDFDYLVEDKSQAKNIYNAIEALNAKFKFGISSVENSVEFQRCKIDFHKFDAVRKKLLKFNKNLSQLTFTEIQLITLELLIDNPDIVDKYREDYDLIVVDEYQDLSLLSLQIFNLIAKKIVCIGDIRQQIYEYKGANPFVCDSLKDMREDIKEIPLTKSYRCPKVVRDFSLEILKHSKYCKEEDFEPLDEQGELFVSRNQMDNLVGIMNELEESAESYMIMFRNNLSAFPILDSLYRRKVDTYAPGFKPGYSLPILDPICRLTSLISNPTSVDLIEVLREFVPEWNRIAERDIPIRDLMLKSGLPFWDIAYEYEYPTEIMEFFRTCKDVKRMLNNKEKFILIFDKLYKWYVRLFLEKNNNKYYLSFDYDLAVRAISFAVKAKHTFEEFLSFESDKEKFFLQNKDQGCRVQVYTFFSAKGLEADNVILLDVNSAIVPSTKRVEKMLKNNQELDAYTAINNEINVLFVAATRAKKKLIVLSEEEMSKLLPNENNPYVELLDRYKNISIYDTVESYISFLR